MSTTVTTRAQNEEGRSHHQRGNYPHYQKSTASTLLSITQQAEKIAISAHTMASVLDPKPIMPDACWKCNLPLYKRIWCKSTDLCWRCQGELLKKITRNNKRARVKGHEASLTIAQWGKILHDSQGHCCYCHKYIGFRGLVIEHRLPIAKGGGTTAENCVPACGSCNSQRWIEGVQA